jgi:uncharacterized protein (TIGR00369 family)
MTPEILQAEGWTIHGGEGFTAHLSPFWYKMVEDRLAVGFIAEERHCNTHLGTVHGGALMTFADIAGGFAVARALGHQRCATVQLQTQFTAVPRRGEFVHCVVEIVRQTRDLIFLRAVVESAGRIVVSFDGIWKALAER